MCVFASISALCRAALSRVALSRVALALWVGTGVAMAADRAALVIGNEVYQRAGPAPDAAMVMPLAQQLAGHGFTVHGAREPGRAETLNLIDSLTQDARGALRIAIVLSGHFVRSGQTGWFVPADAPPPTLGNLPAQAVPVPYILDLAANVPGGALVILGQPAREPVMGPGLRAGYGVLDVPQGVTVVTGPSAQVAQLARDGLLAPGKVMVDLIGDTGPDIRVRGYVSRSEAFIPGQVVQPLPTSPLPALPALGDAEQTLWRSLRDVNTIEAYESYLNTYPTGRFADEARRRAELIRTAPQRRAEAAEAALALNLEARRQAQRDLELLGFDPRGIDGIFGPATRAAITAWQTERGVPKTGYLTRNQIETLRNTAQRRADELAAEARRKEEELRAADAAYWRKTGKKGGEKNFLAYLQQYPDGRFSDAARRKLDELIAAKRAKLESRERKAWDDAVAKNTVEGYRDYMRAFPRGIFEAEAGARIDELEQQARNKAMVEAARAEEDGLKLPPVTLVLAERKLAALGFEPGPEDGKLDKATRRAVRRFQRAAGLPVTGYLTRATIVRLITG